MARRRQTTGMPKKERQEQARQQQQADTNNPAWLENLLGNPKTRVEREEAYNRLLIRGTTAIGVFIAVIIVGALAFQQFIVPNQTVAVVNGDNITVAQFQDRVRLEQRLVLQELQNIELQAQQQAAQFGIEASQLLQNDQRYTTLSQEFRFGDQLGRRVINDMVDDLLVQQAAAERNITIDDEMVQGEVNEFFGFDPTQIAFIGTPATSTPTPTITPTPFVSPTPTATPLPTLVPEITEEATAEATEEVTEEATADTLPTLAPSPTSSQEERLEEFDENVETFRNNIRSDAGVGNGVVDALFERRALQEAITTDLFGELNSTTFVNVRHILVETEEEAQDILAALENGESFAGLARALSTDPGSGSRGGELGWSPASNFVTGFKEATLESEIGVIVGPVESEFGFHVIQVRAREDRDIEAAQRNQVRNAEFLQWLQSVREENEDNIEIFDTWTNYVPDLGF